MNSAPAAVSIPDALAAFSEQWQPHRLVSVNDQDAGGERTAELRELG